MACSRSSSLSSPLRSRASGEPVAGGLQLALTRGERLALPRALVAHRGGEVVGQPLRAELVDEVERLRTVRQPGTDAQRAERPVRPSDGLLVGVAGGGDQAEQPPGDLGHRPRPGQELAGLGARLLLGQVLDLGLAVLLRRVHRPARERVAGAVRGDPVEVAGHVDRGQDLEDGGVDLESREVLEHGGAELDVVGDRGRTRPLLLGALGAALLLELLLGRLRVPSPGVISRELSDMCALARSAVSRWLVRQAAM